MTNNAETRTPELTPSLEDYLETILQLTRTRPVARIKDIAEARGVKAGSVSPAMKRIEALGLIKYGRNEYIELTADGERAARRILSRHQILTSFFEDILRMPRDEAEREACVMEHGLSDGAMDRLVRFFEFLRVCPEAPRRFLERFHQCGRLHQVDAEGGFQCRREECKRAEHDAERTTVRDLAPGDEGTVIQVRAAPAIRQRLLDMGVLPGVTVRLERAAPGGDPLWLRVGGYQLSLRRDEAAGILLELASPSSRERSV